ncbi:hypothetical protein QE364_000106 [Nocardioides zeae]|uniref:Uncharacterized protein n=1 Tax=Nocardioides zeae TaxID=1457234 RepID=A0ACC6ICP6_9ACTN|nr:hypothetical protein [Nocardioides zeae]MDR6175487.1 hypothetical protein [Nocardioides zeae]MDR6208418.1 hypothetical protein [Nocardioides zeae]
MGPNERALLEALQGADDTDPTALAAAGPFAVLGGIATVGDTHWSEVGREVDDTRTELGPVVSDVRGGTVLGATPASAMVASIERAAADLAARVEALTTGAGAEATAGWALFAARAAYRGEGDPGPAPRPTPVPAGTPPEERIATALADSQARQAHEQALAAREARMGQILATLTAELAASRDTFAAINAESGRDSGGDGGTSQHDAHGSGGSTVSTGGAGAVVPAGAHLDGSQPHSGDTTTSPPRGLVLGSPASIGGGESGPAGAGLTLGGGLATGIGAAAGAAALGAGAVVAARRALGGLTARGATGAVGSASSSTRTTARPTSRPGVLGAPATATSNASRTANGAARPASTGGTRGSGPLAAGHSASNAAGGRRGRRTDRDRDTDRVHYPGDGDWLDDRPSGPAVLR